MVARVHASAGISLLLRLDNNNNSYIHAKNINIVHTLEVLKRCINICHQTLNSQPETLCCANTTELPVSRYNSFVYNIP